MTVTMKTMVGGTRAVVVMVLVVDGVCSETRRAVLVVVDRRFLQKKAQVCLTMPDTPIQTDGVQGMEEPTGDGEQVTGEDEEVTGEGVETKGEEKEVKGEGEEVIDVHINGEEMTGEVEVCMGTGEHRSTKVLLLVVQRAVLPS